jgi:hypothetical protein
VEFCRRRRAELETLLYCSLLLKFADYCRQASECVVPVNSSHLRLRVARDRRTTTPAFAVDAKLSHTGYPDSQPIEKGSTPWRAKRKQFNNNN